MKIAHVVGPFPRLSQTFVLNEIIACAKAGHAVEIFALNKTRDNCGENAKEFDFLSKTLFFDQIKARDIFAVNFFVLLKFFIKAVICNFSAKSISATLKFNLKISFFALRIRKQKCDLIHAHFGNIGNFCLLLKRITGVPSITTFYGGDIFMALKENPDLYIELFKNCDHFIALSNHIKERLIAVGCPKEKISVHNIGVDVEDIKFKMKDFVRDGDINILIVGRLVEKKGIYYAIEAFSIALRKYKNIKLRIIGDGPLKGDLKHQVKRLNIAEKVLFLGALRQDKVINEMYNCHIFMLASVTAENGDQEGLGFVFAEAQAAGMPVISTWHNGIPEIVIHKKTGFLVEERNVDALAERLCYLLEHQEVWNELGKNGRKFVEEKYNIRKQINKLEKIYMAVKKQK